MATFNNTTWKKYQEAVGDRIKALEETMIAKTANELSHDLTMSSEMWARKRLERTQVIAQLYRTEIRRARDEILAITEEGLRYSARVATDNMQVDDVPIMRLRASMETELTALWSRAINDYRMTVQRVALDSRGLFDAITTAIREKSDDGYVVYQGGRKVSFKSYMEMSVRTEMQNNALTNMEKSAVASGVELFIASSHSDSADDHAEYQGKYYLADGVVWRDEFARLDMHPTAKYLSDAKAAGFLTRPNCRHYVMPVTTPQAMASPNGDAMRKRLGMPNEDAERAKYKALEKQRHNERQIRKYKSRVINDEITLANITDPDTKTAAMAQLRADKAKVAEWQRVQRAHIKDSGLKRQYIREKPGVIVEDLGARLSIKRSGV